MLAQLLLKHLGEKIRIVAPTIIQFISNPDLLAISNFSKPILVNRLLTSTMFLQKTWHQSSPTARIHEPQMGAFSLKNSWNHFHFSAISMRRSHCPFGGALG